MPTGTADGARVRTRGRDGGRRLRGCLGTVVALALAVATAALLGRSWNTCDVGVNNAANGSFLVLLFVPGLWAVLLLAWGAVGALAGHRPVVHACALGVTLLAVAWCSVSIFRGATPSPMCPDGTPSWWPDPVPAPGF